MNRYRIEAKVLSEDYAHILRDAIESTKECRLTAFEPEISNFGSDSSEDI